MKCPNPRTPCREIASMKSPKKENTLETSFPPI